MSSVKQLKARASAQGGEMVTVAMHVTTAAPCRERSIAPTPHTQSQEGIAGVTQRPSHTPTTVLGRGQSPPLTVIQDDQERSQQVAHPLHVANLNVLPDVAGREKERQHQPLPHTPVPLPAGVCPAFILHMLACSASCHQPMGAGSWGISDMFVPLHPCSAPLQLACK